MQDAEGAEILTDFWSEKYLKEYIAYGGSKIKFITGKKGSGNRGLSSGGKALTELGVPPDYQTLSNLECQEDVPRESDSGC